MSEGSNVQSILIVEDNDDDYEATLRALQREKHLKNPVFRCSDGLDAWEYLNGTGRYAPPNDTPRPGLVLLDLNMPGLDGRQLLQRMKSDIILREIPVVVMTTSTAEEDIRACYKAGANTYIRKPASWVDFKEAITRLHEYWFHFAILPAKAER